MGLCRTVKRLLTLLLLFIIGCSAVPAADGFPVIQAPVAGHTFSCKGTRCCWPWDEKGMVYVCIEPVEGSYLGAGGIMFELRGKMP